MTSRLVCKAILFDMDGVLVDSSAVVMRTWRRWGALRQVDPEPFMRVAHGRRTSDTLRLVDPALDLEKEVAWLDAAEREDFEGVVAIPGAAALLEELPAHRWALVTSASRPIAIGRLAAAALPVPVLMVSSERVTRGKPAPDGYLLAARGLGLEPSDCLVFEDAPAAVDAGKAAGMRVVGLLTTHASLGAADLSIPDLTAVRRVTAGEQLVLEVG